MGWRLCARQLDGRFISIQQVYGMPLWYNGKGIGCALEYEIQIDVHPTTFITVCVSGMWLFLVRAGNFYSTSSGV
jgi:hypothetical protein